MRGPKREHSPLDDDPPPGMGPDGRLNVVDEELSILDDEQEEESED